MNKLVVVTRMDQLNGFRLAGVDAIGVDDPDALTRLITSWLNNKDRLLLALDDSLFTLLSPELVKRLYASEDLHLVTLPNLSRTSSGQRRAYNVYDMIRHATGQEIRFKGESYGTKH